jgi:hypothetical protein
MRRIRSQPHAGGCVRNHCGSKEDIGHRGRREMRGREDLLARAPPPGPLLCKRLRIASMTCQSRYLILANEALRVHDGGACGECGSSGEKSSGAGSANGMSRTDGRRGRVHVHERWELWGLEQIVSRSIVFRTRRGTPSALNGKNSGTRRQSWSSTSATASTSPTRPDLWLSAHRWREFVPVHLGARRSGHAGQRR